MKKLIIMFIGIIGLMTSCNQSEIDQLEAERKESMEVAGEKNNKINSLLEELNYIADNLQSIRERQGIYSTLTMDSGNDVELSETPEDKVRSEIEMIDYLMTNNLDRIASLEKKLEGSGEEMKQVKKLMDNYKKEVKVKIDEIQALKEEVMDLEGQYADLMDEHMNSEIFIALQSKQIELRDNELNSVYFAYGTKEELMDNDVIQKKGGVLGVGAVKSLKNDFNKNYFTKVDLRKLDVIPVSGKKVELLTEHPEETYELVRGEDDLISEIRITNKDSFWSGSHYLVMITK